MPSFEIVRLDSRGNATPVDIGRFPDGKSAASIIVELVAKNPGVKFQPRPVKDETNDWRLREKKRFEDGVYQPLGWDLKPIVDHFAHRAIKNPANVAYTVQQQDGLIDKQTSIHVRVYLQRFYPSLTVEQKRKLIWDYCGESFGDKLHFAVTREEIAEVYTKGPRSCMSETSDYYNDDGYHPSEAYSGPDLQVAYLKDGDRITARCIVWPEKKIAGGYYGDYDKISAALKDEGYTDGNYSEFRGARLSAITLTRGYYLCPYLDISGYVKLSDDGKYLILCGGEGEEADNTSGKISL